MDLLNRLLSEPTRPIPQERWEAALVEAVGNVVRDLSLTTTARLEAARACSRIPIRRMKLLLPDPDWIHRLEQRLLSSAVPLERLARIPPDTADPDQLRANALNTAWDEMETLLGEEERRIDQLVLRVREWRRPVLPLWIITVTALLLTTLIAIWLSGLLNHPAWFEPIARWYWS